LFSPSNHKGFNGLFIIGYRMDRKRRYVHALGPYGLDVINSNEAQNLAQISIVDLLELLVVAATTYSLPVSRQIEPTSLKSSQNPSKHSLTTLGLGLQIRVSSSLNGTGAHLLRQIAAKNLRQIAIKAIGERIAI
jgi:hypothetical protein